MILYAITDRRLLAGEEDDRAHALMSLVREWVRGGVDFIQIREKDLSGGNLLALAARVVAAARADGSPTRVLLNGPAEMALEAGADGVHLTGGAAPGAAAAVRAAYARIGRRAILSRSCHSIEEVAQAADTLALFGPVFEKPLGGEQSLPGKGLGMLGQACGTTSGAVLALGGVTAENAHRCIEAGAAGIAGIRLFLGEDWGGLRTRRL